MKTKHLIIIFLGVCLLFSCDKAGSLEVITYPKTGKYGTNILADEVVMVKRTGGRFGSRFEYSVKAELPASSSLKIVIRCEEENHVWGGYNQDSEENWLISLWNNDLRGNTWTVIESGKSADATVIFSDNCIIEYYENGATTPTKMKKIKVID